jgi:transcription antitermination protein NusB
MPLTPSEIHQARRLALQMLCSLDVQGDDGWLCVDAFLAEQAEADAVKSWARELARATFADRARWDERIVDVSLRWDLPRMGLVDRNILRLALYELGRSDVTPFRVAINEAIELAKEFGTEESPSFVNGVLDAVWKKKATDNTQRTTDN